MNKLVILAVCLAAASAADLRRPLLIKKPQHNPSEADPVDLKNPIAEAFKRANLRPTEAELEQNNNARYEFSADIDDNIHDLSNHRHEVRDGLKVVGQFAYSDGFFYRTTYYEADENGYRVTKQEEIPLEGPIEHLSGGEAVVSSNAHGSQLSYKVKSVQDSSDEDKYVIEEVL